MLCRKLVARLRGWVSRWDGFWGFAGKERERWLVGRILVVFWGGEIAL